MNKINEFMNKISRIYGIIYVIILHIIGIGIIAAGEVDFTQNTADIILGILSIILIFVLCDIVFLIPSIGLIALGTLISVIITISIPLFLILSLFQVCGSESVDILNYYGFIKTLLICIGITPFGIMNLKSLKALNI